MKDNINIEELFKQKFEGFESNVSPDAWANIAKGIGAQTTATTAAAAKAGLSTFAKVAIISGGVIVAGATGFYLMDNDEQQKPEIAQDNTVEMVEENQPQTENEVINSIHVQDPGDSAIENNRVNINDAIQENHIPELTVPQGIVEEILFDAEDQNDEIFIFERIAEGSQENPINSQNNIVAEGSETTEETNNTQVNNSQEENSAAVEVVEVDSDEENDAEMSSVDYATESTDTEYISDEECIDNEIDVFTPGNDGLNDYWFVKTKDIKTFVIQVVDRNGETVFTSTDKDFKWDGTNRFGERVEDGTYTYVIVAKRNNGKELVMQGTVYVE